MKIENFIMVCENGNKLFYEGVTIDGIVLILN